MKLIIYKIINGIHSGKICNYVSNEKDNYIVDCNGRKLEIKKRHLKEVFLDDSQLKELEIKKQCLEYIVDHPYLKKLGFTKNSIGYNYAYIWLAKSTFKTDIHDSFADSNRLFLDEPNKPDGWKSVSELISCSLSRFRFITRQ